MRVNDDKPLIIIAGGDTLVESVCKELCDLGHRVAVICDTTGDLRERVEPYGATLIARSPMLRDALQSASIERAQALMALDENDRFNIEIVLQARELNPGVRVVMRQFNRALGRKIEQNLQNCSVMSLAAHSAATYAAAAIERNTFLGVEFPSGSRSVVSFTRRTAQDAGVAGLDAQTAQERLNCRILSGTSGDDRTLNADEELVLFAPLETFAAAPPPLRTNRRTLKWIAPRILAIASEFDPLLRILSAAALTIFVVATVFFGWSLHLDPITAAYFVVSTMTTVGYGDIAVGGKSHLLQIADIALMISAVVMINLAMAFVAAALVRAQWNALQGLRPIRDAGHVVVFGAGRVGTRVVDYLAELHAIVTVVELNPTPELLRRARSREISLLTGDGTLDATLDLCNLGAARAIVVATDKDATNLEVGFGARARNNHVPVVMRVTEPAFARAIRHHFEIRQAFSQVALASSALADLVASAAARGRVAFAERSFRVAELAAGAHDARIGMPIAAHAKGRTRLVGSWDDVLLDDTVLVLLEETAGGGLT